MRRVTYERTLRNPRATATVSGACLNERSNTFFCRIASAGLPVIWRTYDSPIRDGPVSV